MTTTKTKPIQLKDLLSKVDHSSESDDSGDDDDAEMSSGEAEEMSKFINNNEDVASASNESSSDEEEVVVKPPRKRLRKNKVIYSDSSSDDDSAFNGNSSHKRLAQLCKNLKKRAPDMDKLDKQIVGSEDEEESNISESECVLKNITVDDYEVFEGEVLFGKSRSHCNTCTIEMAKRYYVRCDFPKGIFDVREVCETCRTNVSM
jgi:hypothetical protein